MVVIAKYTDDNDLTDLPLRRLWRPFTASRLIVVSPARIEASVYVQAAI